jgi:hypothetical protein
MLISLAAILSFILYRKYFPTYVTVCYLGLDTLRNDRFFRRAGGIDKKAQLYVLHQGIGTFVNIGFSFCS